MLERADKLMEKEPPEAEDPRLVAALEEYRGLLSAGAPPSRQAFVGRFPDIAVELSDCLEGLEFVHAAASQLRGSQDSWGEGISTDRVLGDFRIVGEIGRGGMGIVYEAEQVSLGRRVALKVLTLAAGLDKRHLQRFHFEAQAAALLNHANIVPVFSVGCSEGLHYYAMQLIEGQSLSAVINTLRRALGLEVETDAFGPAPRCQEKTVDWAKVGVGHPSASLCQETSPAGAGKTQSQFLPAGGNEADDGLPGFAIGGSIRRLEYVRGVSRLGVQVAEALEHAHQLGIVHRDIKPANLLIDRAGHLWVADFGLAHFQRDVRLTSAGAVVGTLRFMSPEQASGRPVIDHRADIFALGASLYELLTLQPAFPGTDLVEIERRRAEGPRSLRLLNPSVPHDLETIVLKALAYSPEERYGSARELAEDLQRFLQHQPILARRPSLRKRVTLWARRHRTLVGAGAVMVLLALAGLSLSTLLIAREQQKTQTAFLAEKQQRDLAEKNFRQAEESFRQAREAVDLLTQVCGELPDRRDLRDVRRQMLEAALAYYRAFLHQRGDDPSLRKELVSSQLRVGHILEELDRKVEAAAAFEQARKLHEQLASDQPFVIQLRAVASKKLPGRMTSKNPRLPLHLEPAVIKEMDAEHEVVVVTTKSLDGKEDREITIDFDTMFIDSSKFARDGGGGKLSKEASRLTEGSPVVLLKDKEGGSVMAIILEGGQKK